MEAGPHTPNSGANRSAAPQQQFGNGASSGGLSYHYQQADLSTMGQQQNHVRPSPYGEQQQQIIMPRHYGVGGNKMVEGAMLISGDGTNPNNQPYPHHLSHQFNMNSPASPGNNNNNVLFLQHQQHQQRSLRFHHQGMPYGEVITNNMDMSNGPMSNFLMAQQHQQQLLNQSSSGNNNNSKNYSQSPTPTLNQLLQANNAGGSAISNHSSIEQMYEGGGGGESSSIGVGSNNNSSSRMPPPYMGGGAGGPAYMQSSIHAQQQQQQHLFRINNPSMMLENNEYPLSSKRLPPEYSHLQHQHHPGFPGNNNGALLPPTRSSVMSLQQTQQQLPGHLSSNQQLQGGGGGLIHGQHLPPPSYPGHHNQQHLLLHNQQQQASHPYIVQQQQQQVFSGIAAYPERVNGPPSGGMLLNRALKPAPNYPNHQHQSHSTNMQHLPPHLQHAVGSPGSQVYRLQGHNHHHMVLVDQQQQQSSHFYKDNGGSSARSPAISITINNKPRPKSSSTAPPSSKHSPKNPSKSSASSSNASNSSHNKPKIVNTGLPPGLEDLPLGTVIDPALVGGRKGRYIKKDGTLSKYPKKKKKTAQPEGTIITTIPVVAATAPPAAPILMDQATYRNIDESIDNILARAAAAANIVYPTNNNNTTNDRINAPVPAAAPSNPSNGVVNGPAYANNSNSQLSSTFSLAGSTENSQSASGTAILIPPNEESMGHNASRTTAANSHTSEFVEISKLQTISLEPSTTSHNVFAAATVEMTSFGTNQDIRMEIVEPEKQPMAEGGHQFDISRHQVVAYETKQQEQPIIPNIIDLAAREADITLDPPNLLLHTTDNSFHLPVGDSNIQFYDSSSHDNQNVVSSKPSAKPLSTPPISFSSSNNINSRPLGSDNHHRHQPYSQPTTTILSQNINNNNTITNPSSSTNTLVGELSVPVDYHPITSFVHSVPSCSVANNTATTIATAVVKPLHPTGPQHRILDESVSSFDESSPHNNLVPAAPAGVSSYHHQQQQQFNHPQGTGPNFTPGPSNYYHSPYYHHHQGVKQEGNFGNTTINHHQQHPSLTPSGTPSWEQGGGATPQGKFSAGGPAGYSPHSQNPHFQQQPGGERNYSSSVGGSASFCLSPGAASLKSTATTIDEKGPPPPTTPSTTVASCIYSNVIINTSIVTTARKNEPVSRLYEFGNEPDRRLFLDHLLKFNEQNANVISFVPTVSKAYIDLYKLYHLVKERGGVIMVNQKKLWREIAVQVLEGQSNAASASYNLRKQYVKCLLDYECKYDLNGADPAPIIAQLEASTKKKKKKPIDTSLKSSENTMDSQTISTPSIPDLNRQYSHLSSTPSFDPHHPLGAGPSHPHHLMGTNQYYGPHGHPNAIPQGGGQQQYFSPGTGQQHMTQAFNVPPTGSASLLPTHHHGARQTGPHHHSRGGGGVGHGEAATSMAASFTNPPLLPPNVNARNPFSDVDSFAHHQQQLQQQKQNTTAQHQSTPPPLPDYYQQQQSVHHERTRPLHLPAHLASNNPTAQGGGVGPPHSPFKPLAAGSPYPSSGGGSSHYHTPPSSSSAAAAASHLNYHNNNNPPDKMSADSVQAQQQLSRSQHTHHQQQFSGSNRDGKFGELPGGTQIILPPHHPPPPPSHLIGHHQQQQQHGSMGYSPQATAPPDPYHASPQHHARHHSGSPVKHHPPVAPSPLAAESQQPYPQQRGATASPFIPAQQQQQIYHHQRAPYYHSQPQPLPPPSKQQPPGGPPYHAGPPPTSHLMYPPQQQPLPPPPPYAPHHALHPPPPSLGSGGGQHHHHPALGYPHQPPRGGVGYPPSQFAMQHQQQQHIGYDALGNAPPPNIAITENSIDPKSLKHTTATTQIHDGFGNFSRAAGPHQLHHQHTLGVGVGGPYHHHNIAQYHPQDSRFNITTASGLRGGDFTIPPNCVEGTSVKYVKFRRIHPLKDIGNFDIKKLAMILNSGIFHLYTAAIDTVNVLLSDDSKNHQFALGNTLPLKYLDLLLDYYEIVLGSAFSTTKPTRPTKFKLLKSTTCTKAAPENSNDVNCGNGDEDNKLGNDDDVTGALLSVEEIKKEDLDNDFISKKPITRRNSCHSNTSASLSHKIGENAHVSVNNNNINKYGSKPTGNSKTKNYTWVTRRKKRVKVDNVNKSNRTPLQLPYQENEMGDDLKTLVRPGLMFLDANLATFRDDLPDYHHHHNLTTPILRKIRKPLSEICVPLTSSQPIKSHSDNINKSEYNEEDESPLPETGPLDLDATMTLFPLASENGYNNLLTMFKIALGVSNIIRSLSFVQGNDTHMAKNKRVFELISRVLLLRHSHTVPFTDDADEEGDRGAVNNNDENQSPTTTFGVGVVSASTKHYNQNERDCWLALSRDALVVLSNIAGKTDLATLDDTILFPLINGLSHTLLCDYGVKLPAAKNIAFALGNALPIPGMPAHGCASPRRYLVLEVLCKLSVSEANVDHLLAILSLDSVESLVSVLIDLLALNTVMGHHPEVMVLKEMALILMTNLGGAFYTLEEALSAATASFVGLNGTDSNGLVSDLISHHSRSLPAILSFMEEIEANANRVIVTQGFPALRDNPELMGTSLAMLRRCANLLLMLALKTSDRTLFDRHQPRLLNLVMSQILDQNVANILAHVLYVVAPLQPILSQSSPSFLPSVCPKPKILKNNTEHDIPTSRSSVDATLTSDEKEVAITTEIPA